MRHGGTEPESYGPSPEVSRTEVERSFGLDIAGRVRRGALMPVAAHTERPRVWPRGASAGADEVRAGIGPPRARDVATGPVATGPHQAIAIAVSNCGGGLVVRANSEREWAAGSALTPVACSMACRWGAALTTSKGMCR